MTRGKRAALGLIAVMLVAGCASNAPGDLNSSAAKVLRPAVEQVRQAAASGSYSDLQHAVQQLKDLVQQQERSGAVTAQRANAIEDAAAALLQDAKPSPSPTPIITTESPTPTPTLTTPSPTPTSESPTPTPTSASPTPTKTSSPQVSFSAVAQSPRQSPHHSPDSSPTP
jgi:hypothetical protein